MKTHERIIDLKRGGYVKIYGRFSLFDLEENERELLTKLTDVFNDYERKYPAPTDAEADRA